MFDLQDKQSTTQYAEEDDGNREEEEEDTKQEKENIVESVSLFSDLDEDLE